ncbi:glycoside hydrolase family 27 protein [Hymenopellis radicata]|nr:glycoside hydrolase family 27 protein [Hymenopellis radicata]
MMRLLLTISLLLSPVLALDNGVGRLPFMGFNTWNAYYCHIDESLILNTAKLIVSLGLADAGYEYMNIDDCYSEKERNSAGDIVESSTRFPSGMRNLTDRLHDLGLKAGIYSDSGWFTCQLYPGSFQNEDRDAKLFRDTWNFDLLKFDNCAVPHDEVIREGMIGRYSRMANALSALSKSTGRDPMLFSLCQWGRLEPWLWARRLGHTWRTTDDISSKWSSIAKIINQNSFHAWASDFYGHNDLDILEVGNGKLTNEESKTHFTVWALMKSPLLILTKISDATLQILTNKEIIAINQDPIIGTGVTPFRWGYRPNYTNDPKYPAQYWSGESQNGTVIMMINVHSRSTDLQFSFSESPWLRLGRQYAIRDLWTHTDNGTFVRGFTARAVPAHGVVALLLQDAGDEPAGLEPKCAFYEWWSADWCYDHNRVQAPNPNPADSEVFWNLRAMDFVYSASSAFEYLLRRIVLIGLRRDYM